MIEKHSTKKRQPWLDPMVSLMDDRFRVPGTRFRFGLDAIVGALVPVVGDSFTTALGAVLLFVAWRDGAPPRLLVRMAANLAIDTAVGAIPLLGDWFDAGFHAHRKNHTLLRAFQHQKFGAPLPNQNFGHADAASDEAATKRVGSWLTLVLLLLVIGVLVLIPFAALALFLHRSF